MPSTHFLNIKSTFKTVVYGFLRCENKNTLAQSRSQKGEATFKPGENALQFILDIFDAALYIPFLSSILCTVSLAELVEWLTCTKFFGVQSHLRAWVKMPYFQFGYFSAILAISALSFPLVVEIFNIAWSRNEENSSFFYSFFLAPSCNIVAFFVNYKENLRVFLVYRPFYCIFCHISVCSNYFAWLCNLI